MIKKNLRRDLRRSILRGHPWVYREAVEGLSSSDKAQLCQVYDSKKQSLAWAILDPLSPIALRILSTEKKPPSSQQFLDRFIRAKELRLPISKSDTNCFRLINGEGDELPGLICDVYDKTAVLQFDGAGMAEFWSAQPVVDWVRQVQDVDCIYLKARHDMSISSRVLYGGLQEEEIEVRENGVRFLVDVVNGQKTGFFLDQRDNRQHLSGFTANKKVLNLFSYSGGFSLYAGITGASVTSVDIAPQAIKGCENNWLLNGLPNEKHVGVAADVSEFLESHHEKFDVVIVDPPSMASSEKHKDQAMRKYSSLFALAVKRTTAGGHLFFSSCSSHISFEDFLLIIEEAMSQARQRGRILRISGQGLDHPFPHACTELRYLKFVHLVLA